MLRLALLLTLVAGAALAQGTTRISDRATFLNMVEGRELSRFAVTLQVATDGSISGRGFGQSVSGTWEWRDGFFCRSLDWATGGRPMNCQAVFRDGNAVIFVADRGQGDSARLTIK